MKKAADRKETLAVPTDGSDLVRFLRSSQGSIPSRLGRHYPLDSSSAACGCCLPIPSFAYYHAELSLKILLPFSSRNLEAEGKLRSIPILGTSLATP